MAWIELHASKLVKLNKFHKLRKDAHWSVHECLGFLSLFWGEAIEVCEDGDLSDWTLDYFASVTGLNDRVARLVWDSLQQNGWIDTVSSGGLLIHDWLDYVGLFLTRKYNTSNREKLVEIWAKHGKTYGSTTNPSLENSKRTKSEPTLPNLTNKRYGHSESFPRGEKATKTPTPVAPPPPPLEDFDRFWSAYPRKVAKPMALKAFKSVAKDIAQILTGLELAKKRNAENWAKDDGKFIPHPSTWLNQRRWEDELANTDTKPKPKLHPYARPFNQPVQDSRQNRSLGQDDANGSGIHANGQAV